MKNLNFKVSDELHYAIKIKALEEKLNMQEFIIKTLELRTKIKKR